MRAPILIVLAGSLAFLAAAEGAAPGSSGTAGSPVLEPAAQSAEGTVSLVDPARALVVLQERGRAKVLHFTTLPPSLRFGERVSVAGTFQTRCLSVPDYPEHPARSEVLESLETPPAHADHHLSRLRGWVRPPANGNYTFWLAADDEAELWLGSNDDPASAKRIASVSEATAPRQWDHDSTQRSQPLPLRAGRSYYIEVLHREWQGEDHLSVAWQGPRMAQELLGSPHLAPWASPDGTTNGILCEVWTNCFLTSLGFLSPKLSGTPVLEVSEPRITTLGPGDSGTPRRAHLSRPWADERNFVWSEVDGVVRFAGIDRGELVLELADRDPRAPEARMTVRVLDWGARPAATLMNRRIRVRGVCEQTLNLKGEPVAGRLWAQNPKQLALDDVTSLDWRDLELTPMSELTLSNAHLTRGQKVMIRAVVSQQDTNSRTFLACGEDTLEGFISSDGTNWQAVGAPAQVRMETSILVGLAVSSDPEDPKTAMFDHVTWRIPERLEASGFLENTRDTGLGRTQSKATLVFTNSGLSIRPGSGNDWLTSDDGHFVYRTLNGDGEIIARLAFFQPARSSDKAGVMLRETREADAAEASLVLTRGSRVEWQYRPTRGATSVRTSRMSVQTPQWFKLVRHRHTLTARVLEGETLPVGKPIELIGTLDWKNGQPVFLDAYGRRMQAPADTPDASVIRLGPQEAPIADLADLESAPGERLFIRGVVTFMDHAFGRDLLFVQDETGGTLIRAPQTIFTGQNIQAGRLVEAEGRLENAPGEAPFFVTFATTLGWGQWPEPQPFPARADAAKAEGRWVEATGVVRSLRDGRMLLMEKDGLVPIWVGNITSSNALMDYTDALLTVRGVLTLSLPVSPIMLCPSPQFIQLKEAAPANPFELPTRTIAQVRALKLGAQTLHRSKINGVVTYRDGRLLCVQDATGGARVLAANAASFGPGAQVDLAGFPDRSGDSLTFDEALLRSAGPEAAPAPAPLTSDALLDAQWDAVLAQVDAVVLDQKSRGGLQLLELQSGQRILSAWLPVGAGALPVLPAGSRVRVIGVSQLRYASRPGDPLSLNPATMELWLRSPADLQLLHRPPWWNWRHTAALVGALALVLAGAFLWIRTLRRRVEDRTRELKQAMGRLQKETEVSATLTERSRLAAEIHDTLEQGLSGISMQLDSLDSALKTSPEAAPVFLERARRMVTFSRGEVRNSLWNLESQLLKEGGLDAALREIAHQMGAGNTVKVHVLTDGKPQPLPPAVQHHMLRCAQESLNNAFKHAGALTVHIRLSYGQDAVRLTVADDGRGFDPESVLAEPGKSLGLRNLRSRSRKIKAQLTITSQPGNGTTVQLTAPLTAGDKPIALSGHTDTPTQP